MLRIYFFILYSLAGSFFVQDCSASDVTLNFTGNIIAAPCKVTPGDEDQIISLGDNISQSDLSAAGSYTPWVAVKLHLDGCPAGLTTLSMDFSGTPDADSTDMYKNVGTAKNVAVNLSGTGGQTFGVGAHFDTPANISGGTFTFNMQARAYSKLGNVTPGSISSIATIALSYA